MIVRIIKSSYEDAWYAKHIGEQFEVEKRTNKYGTLDYVKLPFDSNGDFYIDADDCETVQAANKTSLSKEEIGGISIYHDLETK